MSLLHSRVGWGLVAGACCSTASAQCELFKMPLPEPAYNGWGMHTACDGNLFAVASNSQDDAPGMAVFALRRSGTTLVNEGRLIPDPPINPNITRFGQGLSVSGNRIAVGDYQSGLNNRGRVYIFDHTGSGWTQTATIAGVDESLQFGYAVGLNGDTLAVSKPTRGAYPGEVRIYRFDGATWNFTQSLPNPDSSPFGAYGSAITMDGSQMLVGGAVEFGFDPEDGSRAYVYQDGPGGYSLTGTLAPEGAGFSFGSSGFGTELDIDGDVAIVGAPEEGGARGAAYVYRRTDASGWFLSQRITGPLFAGSFPEYGSGVGIRWGRGTGPDLIVIGTEGDERAANTAGAVQIYSGDPGEYGFVADIFASDASEGARFGSDIALSGNTFLVGARSDTASSPPPPITNNLDGSAYLFANIVVGCDGFTPDLCAIKAGTPDTNSNDIPDGCETPSCLADFNGDGLRDPDDLADFITCFFLDVQFPGFCPEADFNHDTFRDPDDLADFITTFFTSTC